MLTDWKNFKAKFTSTVELNVPIKTVGKIYIEAINFTLAIQQAAWNSIPEIRKRTVGTNYAHEINW